MSDENHSDDRIPGLEFLIQFVQRVPDAVCICDAADRILFANSEWLEITGYEETEIISKSIQLLIPDFPPVSPQKDSRSWESCLQTKNDGSFDAQFHVVSLHSRHGDIRLIRVSHDKDRFSRFDLFSRSDELYRITINSLGDYIHLIDSDLRCLMYNAAAAKAVERYSGIKGSLLGKTVFEFFPFLPVRVKDEYQQVLKTGKPLTTAEWTLVNKEKFWTETRKIPILDEDGITNVIITIVRDITEMKKIEESLRSVMLTMEDRIKSATQDLETTNLALNKEIAERKKTEEELELNRASLEAQYKALPLPTYTWKLIDNHFTLVSFNDAAIEITQGAISRFKNCHLEDVHANHPEIIEDILRCHREKTVISREMFFTYQTRNETKYLNVKYGYVTPDTVIVHTEDLTHRRKYETEIQKIHKLESLGILAGGIAHDFNNILTGLMGLLELAGISIGRSHQAFNLLEKAQKAVMKSKALTGQLLTFSKGGSPIRKPENIQELIVNSVEFILKGKPVEYKLDIQEDLWIVEIDASQIFQVLNNLVINAVQAMPEGGGIEIRMSNVENPSAGELPLENGKYVKIRIKDQGEGIPAEIREKIFDPYFSTKPQGMGLGLAIAHSIIHKHNGHIAFESEKGRGAAFDIYLPASEKTTIHAATPSGKIPKGRGRVLVMDDEDLILDVVKLMLEDLGYEALLSKNGSDLIEIYKDSLRNNTPVYAVIMDLVIKSGMGGLKTMEKLLEIDPNAKVIVSSGYSNDPVMSNYRDYGFADHVAKPYEMKEIAQKLYQLAHL